MMRVSCAEEMKLMDEYLGMEDTDFGGLDSDGS